MKNKRKKNNMKLGEEEEMENSTTAKESNSKRRHNAPNKTMNILIPIIIICPHFHNTTKIYL
jgi:hypothetical protein